MQAQGVLLADSQTVSEGLGSAGHFAEVGDGRASAEVDTPGHGWSHTLLHTGVLTALAILIAFAMFGGKAAPLRPISRVLGMSLLRCTRALLLALDGAVAEATGARLLPPRHDTEHATDESPVRRLFMGMAGAGEGEAAAVSASPTTPEPPQVDLLDLQAALLRFTAAAQTALVAAPAPPPEHVHFAAPSTPEPTPLLTSPAGQGSSGDPSPARSLLSQASHSTSQPRHRADAHPALLPPDLRVALGLSAALHAAAGWDNMDKAGRGDGVKEHAKNSRAALQSTLPALPFNREELEDAAAQLPARKGGMPPPAAVAGVYSLLHNTASLPHMVFAGDAATAIAGAPQTWLTLLLRVFGLEGAGRAQNGIVTDHMSLLRVAFLVYCRRSSAGQAVAARQVSLCSNTHSQTTARLAFSVLTGTAPPDRMWGPATRSAPPCSVVLPHLASLLGVRTGASVTFLRITKNPAEFTALPSEHGHIVRDVEAAWKKPMSQWGSISSRELESATAALVGPFLPGAHSPSAATEVCAVLVQPGARCPEAREGRIAVLGSGTGVHSFAVQWARGTGESLARKLSRLAGFNVLKAGAACLAHTHVFGEAPHPAVQQVLDSAQDAVTSVSAAWVSQLPPQTPRATGWRRWLPGAAKAGGAAPSPIRPLHAMYTPTFRPNEDLPAYALGQPLQGCVLQCFGAPAPQESWLAVEHPHGLSPALQSAASAVPAFVQHVSTLPASYLPNLPLTASTSCEAGASSRVTASGGALHAAAADRVWAQVYRAHLHTLTHAHLQAPPAKSLAPALPKSGVDASCTVPAAAEPDEGDPLQAPCYLSGALTLSSSLGSVGVEHLSLNGTAHLAYIVHVQAARGLLHPSLLAAFPYVMTTRVSRVLQSSLPGGRLLSNTEDVLLAIHPAV